MGSRINLQYLIEGDQEAFYIFFPRISDGEATTVDTLKQTIFDQQCKDLVPRASNLRLFKVRILFPLQVDSSNIP